MIALTGIRSCQSGIAFELGGFIIVPVPLMKNHLMEECNEPYTTSSRQHRWCKAAIH